MNDKSKKFQDVNAKQSFPEMEQGILKFWEDNNIFEQSTARNRQNKKYVFFDGPPFANGLPHYGHILANALKDAVTRYWTMKGFYVPRTNGWDCHGLPVEYEIEKELEISGRKDIEKFGVANFNDKCRMSVFKYTNEWEKLLKRIGRWVDFDKTYVTLDNDYMESIWWVFKKIWDKGLVYQGYKSMHICPRCETPLSNFEVSQGYKDVTDLSVIAKFYLKDEENTYVLAWTTTPWTLPGNVALAVGPKITYVKIAVKKENGIEKYILAKDLLGKVMGEIEYEVLEELSAEDLKGKEYKPLFPFYEGKLEQKAYYIVVADFVSTEDGTGIVHIAPAFGEDDLNIGNENNLPILQHVAFNGEFKDEVEPWAGKFVKGQDQNIAAWLEEKNLIFSKENYRHSYPHCWRCDTPLLNYATKSWFIRVTDIKKKLLLNNKRIHWQPEHIKDGRFGKWLDGARDWAISRNRFWGCAMPIWECTSCDHKKCIGSIEDLKKNSVDEKLPRNGQEIDLHKPYIDEIELTCEKCGKKMKRIPEVLDCWFESGSMPYAQLHYPFENKEDFEKNFPAQFIAEGLDQTRGWFYTLHVISTILFDSPAFENVIVNGILLAADGEKLSKRKKNYPDPNMLFDTRGVDAVRFFLYSSTAPLAEDVRFSEKHVDEMIKKFLLTIWNTYSFFITYANIDNWKPADEDDDEKFVPNHKLDQWILSELNQLIAETTVQLDQYNLTKATRPMIDFVDNLSNWYIRRSRRRFWKSENDDDKNEAYETLHIVLREFSKLIAPFMPFVADEIYRNVTTFDNDLEESVHLCSWPKVDESMIKLELNNEMSIVRKIVNLGHGARVKSGIKVRQPLSKVQVGLPESVNSQIINAQKNVICEELNVKELEVLTEVGDLVNKIIKPDARMLGPKYGKGVQDIINKVKAGTFEEMTDGRVKVGDVILEKDEFEVGFEGKEGFNVQGEDGFVVILDSHISPELKSEGYAREIIRYVQEMRKKAGFEVFERIYLQVKTDALLEEAVTEFADYIKRETLAIELQQGNDFAWDLEEKVEIDGVEVLLAVRREE
ncbi:isoleucine--tRNA ligase [Patescibacteria group bacterium]|nr:isoleucine--tRNA ligase [Patescibacteria group bacterium]